MAFAPMNKNWFDIANFASCGRGLQETIFTLMISPSGSFKVAQSLSTQTSIKTAYLVWFYFQHNRNK